MIDQLHIIFWKYRSFVIDYAALIIPLLVGCFGFFFFLYIYPSLDKKIAKQTGGYLDWMVMYLDRMFIRWSRQTCFMILMFSTLFFGILGFLMTLGSGFLNFVITISLLYLGWSMPRIIIHYMYKRRLQKFDYQIIDALELMANSLKSGLNLLKIIQVVQQEMPDPISQEFQLVLNQHHLGISLDEALQNMAERVPTEDLSMTISAILILRETGGDLSETFDVISNTIRERRKIEGKIKAITAQGVTQSGILFAMPFGIALAIYFFDPTYLQPMLTNKWGYLLITVTLTLQLLGGLWLKKIVSVDV